MNIYTFIYKGTIRTTIFYKLQKVLKRKSPAPLWITGAQRPAHNLVVGRRLDGHRTIAVFITDLPLVKKLDEAI